VNAAPPAAALGGESVEIVGTGLLPVEIVNVELPEVPPPGAGLVTVMLADPLALMSVAGTAAVS
jgi:hypothetical protein